MRKALALSTLLFLVACGAKPAAPVGEGREKTSTVVQGVAGDAVITFNGGSLKDMFGTAAAKDMKFADLSLLQEPWTAQRVEPGKYFLGQMHPIPVVLMATALLDAGPSAAQDADSPLQQFMDKTSCQKRDKEKHLVGLYWSEGKLWIDGRYCTVQGGGVWEAGSMK